METSSRGRAALATAIGVLVAVAAVAVASRGSTPAGTGGVRAPAQTLLDVLFTLYLLLIVAGGLFLVWLFVMRRWIAIKTGTTKRRGPLETLLSVLILAAIGSLLARQLAGYDPVKPPELPEVLVNGVPGTGPSTTSVEGVADRPGFAWPAAMVTVGLIGLALFAWWLSGRSRKRARGELGRGRRLADELAAAVDESLDDLRAEPDPRRAVIAAYARLERVLGAHGLARRPAEAPLEYLARMLDEVSVSAEAARTLTALFERAKFSQHAVGPAMKNDAISALERVRDDLLAAKALAEREREAALAAQRERAAT